MTGRNEDKPEQEGFEPPVPFGTTVFKTVALNHSATAPSPDNLPFNYIGSNAESRANFQPFYNQMAIFQANSGSQGLPREEINCGKVQDKKQTNLRLCIFWAFCG